MEKIRFRFNGFLKCDKVGIKGVKFFSIMEVFKELLYFIFFVIWGNLGRLLYFKVRLFIFKVVFESFILKFLIFKCLLLVVIFMVNFCNEKLYCLLKLICWMVVFNELLCNVFSESVVVRFFIDR